MEKLISWQRENNMNLTILQITANEQNASAVILSNTEVYLCVHFLSIVFVGGLFSFLISSFLLGTKKNK